MVSLHICKPFHTLEATEQAVLLGSKKLSYLESKILAAKLFGLLVKDQAVWDGKALFKSLTLRNPKPPIDLGSQNFFRLIGCRNSILTYYILFSFIQCKIQGGILEISRRIKLMNSRLWYKITYTCMNTRASDGFSLHIRAVTNLDQYHNYLLSLSLMEPHTKPNSILFFSNFPQMLSQFPKQMEAESHT